MQMFAHLTPENLSQTELAFANNFVVLNAAEQYGLFAPKYPNAETVFGASNLLNHTDWQALYDAYCAAAPSPLPACTLDLLRAAKGDFSDWTKNDPRFISLRRAGCAWEAMLLECALRMPANTRGWDSEMLLDTEQTVDDLLALTLWARAHLLARLAATPADAPSSLCAPPSVAACLPPPQKPGVIGSEQVSAQHTQADTQASVTSDLQPRCDTVEAGGIHASVEADGIHASVEAGGIHAPGLDTWRKRGLGRLATICLAARPDEPLTKQCLEGMARQTCPDTNFLLFLNGDRDAGSAWLPDFLSDHPEFLLARSSRTLPAAHVWNYCFRPAPAFTWSWRA